VPTAVISYPYLRECNDLISTATTLAPPPLPRSLLMFNSENTVPLLSEVQDVWAKTERKEGRIHDKQG